MARREKVGRGWPPRSEVAVSRLEQHHLDALEGTVLQAPAEALAAQRAAGQGFGLVAVVDGEPVGLLGVRFGEDGWALHDLVVGPAAASGLTARLLGAAEELAAPLGSLIDLDGERVDLPRG